MSITAYPRTIRNFNVFVDGFGYAGNVLDAKLPNLELTLAQHRGGGMDGPVPQDLGMEAMTAEATFSEWSNQLVTALGNNQRLVMRPVAESTADPEVDAIVCTLGGLWTMLDFGELKPGNDTPLKVKLSADYFRMVKNGVELFEIDFKASKRVINGADQLAAKRTAMGF